MTWLVSSAIKATLLLAAAWFGAALVRRGTAAARHQIWTLGVLGAVVLPALSGPASVASALPALAGTSFNLPAILVAPGAAGDASGWPTWLAAVWAAGAIAIAFRRVLGHLAARALAREAEPSQAWSGALREAAESLGLARAVELLRSDRIGSPVTIGVLRPRVVLPAAADAWSPARLRAVLVHELGHVCRHDLAIQLAAQLATALYWWNPLAWLAAARLRIEREHACDDLVLAAGIRPSSYAADLLDVARTLALDPHVGAIGMVDRSSTETRLRRILDVTIARRPPRARFRLAMRGVAIACISVLACTASPPAAPGMLSAGAPFVRDPYPLGAPISRGRLDLSAVAAEVHHRLGTLEACYQGRLAIRPALAGTVVVHWTIAETGKVGDACITQDSVGDQGLIDCVNQLVLADRFPAPDGGAVDVSMPFVFGRPAG